jgi:hypothetical protein
MSGWIKLHRSLKDWEWYDDHNATRLLLHLLVSVNYEDKQWKGQTVKAGSMITSWESLAKEVGLSVKQIRLAMSKLESSKEVVRFTTNKWQAVTLVKWDKLQGCNSEQGSQRDSQRATTKEYKEIKKVFSTPTVQEVMEYCKERNNLVDANKFVNFYASKGWMVGKNKMKDWKAAVRTWEDDADKNKLKGIMSHPVIID